MFLSADTYKVDGITHTLVFFWLHNALKYGENIEKQAKIIDMLNSLEKVM